MRSLIRAVRNRNNGFSLVELIVVIAIMAVLVAVLAPALLQYVERSRAQKDDSAMGEVTNAIQLALADQNAYDEALKYVLSGKNGGNYASSCYVDGTSALADSDKVYTKGDSEFYYPDSKRKADETEYSFSGQMRGLTITFTPTAVKEGSKKKHFVLSNGQINSDGQYDTDGVINLGNAFVGESDNKGQIYNKLRAAIGDTVDVTSQTYRNSPYTVFIRMGTTGGNDSANQDAIKVYGQWGGTNLAEQTRVGMQYVNGSGELVQSDVGAQYYIGTDNDNTSKVVVEAPVDEIDKVYVQEDLSSSQMSVVDSSNYTVSAQQNNSDMSLVAFKSEYLETLEEGRHNVKVTTTAGAKSTGVITISPTRSEFSIYDDGTVIMETTSNLGRAYNKVGNCWAITCVYRPTHPNGADFYGTFVITKESGRYGWAPFTDQTHSFYVNKAIEYNGETYYYTNTTDWFFNLGFKNTFNYPLLNDITHKTYEMANLEEAVTDLLDYYFYANNFDE